MSIDEIKDISKLRTMLKNALGELDYIKGCCMNAGKELEKHSFAWDGKEKNLVVQAAELNEKYKQSKQALEKIEEIVTYCKNQDICTFCKYSEKCRDKEDYTLYDNNNLILTIINEVKGAE